MTDIFYKSVDNNAVCFYMFYVATRWFAFKLDMVTTVSWYFIFHLQIEWLYLGLVRCYCTLGRALTRSNQSCDGWLGSCLRNSNGGCIPIHSSLKSRCTIDSQNIGAIYLTRTPDSISIYERRAHSWVCSNHTIRGTTGHTGQPPAAVLARWRRNRDWESIGIPDCTFVAVFISIDLSLDFLSRRPASCSQGCVVPHLPTSEDRRCGSDWQRQEQPTAVLVSHHGAVKWENIDWWHWRVEDWAWWSAL